MNTEQFRQAMGWAAEARSIIELAGLDVQTALVSLEGVSEAQINYAGDVRHAALANVWHRIKEEWQTPQFAQALLRAANRHTSARWWLDRSRHAQSAVLTFSDLDSDLNEELNGE